MSAGSYDVLAEAMALLKASGLRARCVPRDSWRGARSRDILALFLTELRLRRAHVKQRIEMLKREAAAKNVTVRPPVRMPLQACRRRAFRAR